MKDKKIWFITGISSGLGHALAQSVMDSGDFVIGTLRNQPQTDAFNQAHIGQGFAFKLDIRDMEQTDQVIHQTIATYGHIDVLVNNAGIGFCGAVEEASLIEIRQLFDVNVFGAWYLTRAVLPVMRQAKQGHIVQISSHGGFRASAGFGIYNATKFALEGFSEALAQEVAPLGIKVTIVQPGPFRTSFAGDNLMETGVKIEDYSETAGAFVTKLRAIDGQQEGDPKRAAAAIRDFVNSDNPSLRLPLGKTALYTISMKLDQVRADLDTNRAIAEQAIFVQ